MTEMIRNIVPEGIECVFVRQAEQLGLGHAVLCAGRVIEVIHLPSCWLMIFLQIMSGVTADRGIYKIREITNFGDGS